MDHSQNGRGEAQVLRLEITALKQTVSALTMKLEFVLSFLGISESHGITPAVLEGGAVPINTVLAANNASSTMPLPGVAVAVAASQSTLSTTKSYSDAVRVKLVESMKCEVLSAVHTELDTKNKRSINVVIHGLPSATGAGSDLDHVKDFINVEFCNTGFEWNIVACKRLGLRQEQTSGQTVLRFNAAGVQIFPPLLVTLGCTQQAKYLIDNARKLRGSVSDYTRQHVYINPDRTAAESKAAYDQRCKRREKQALRNKPVSVGEDGASTSSSSAPDNVPMARSTDFVAGADGFTTSSAAVFAVRVDPHMDAVVTVADIHQPVRTALDPAVDPFLPRSTDCVT